MPFEGSVRVLVGLLVLWFYSCAFHKYVFPRARNFCTVRTQTLKYMCLNPTDYLPHVFHPEQSLSLILSLSLSLSFALPPSLSRSLSREDLCNFSSFLYHGQGLDVL